MMASKVGKGGATPRQGASCCYSKEFLTNGTPSRKDGLSLQRETRIYRSVYKYLQRCADKLKLHLGVVSTAQIYFLRYFAIKSMRKNDIQMVAMGCLLLSSKLHECVLHGERHLQELVKVCLECQKKKDKDGSKQNNTNSEQYVDHVRKRVVYAEFAVLHAVGFDLTLQPPFKYVLELLQMVTNVDEPKKIQSRQIAYSLLEASMETTLPLQCAPQHLAEVALFMATKGMGLDALQNEKNQKFLDWCSCPLHQLKDFVRQLLDMFELTNDKMLKCLEEVDEAIVKRQITPSPHSCNTTETHKSPAEAPAEVEVEEGEIMA